MASSYYRRIHGHDANLRQGTKTDLTSARNIRHECTDGEGESRRKGYEISDSTNR